MSHSSAVHRPLERAPGDRDNWVEASGGLPSYIERIAKHIRSDSGLSTSRAIASAISQVKRWARGGEDVTAATRAKAAKAVAQWEALKAKNKARQAADLSVARIEGRVIHLATPSAASSDGPRSTIPADRLDTAQRSQLARRGHAIASQDRGGRFPIRNTTDLGKAIRAYGRAKPEDRSKVRAHIIRQARRLRALGRVPDAWLNMAAPHVGLSALELAAVFDGDADIIDLAAVNGRHVPGTPYNWKHGYIPLNARTAIAHNKGFWVTPSGQRKTVADARKTLGVSSNAELKKRMAANPDALKVATKNPVRNRPQRPQTPAAPAAKPAEKPAAPRRSAERPRLVPAKNNPRHRIEEYPDGTARVRDTQANTTTGRMPRTEADTYAAGQNKAKPRRTLVNVEPPGGWTEADRVPEERRQIQVPASRTEVIGPKATEKRPYEAIKRNGKFYVRNTRDKTLAGPMRKATAQQTAKSDNDNQRPQLEDLGDGWQVRRDQPGSWTLYRNGRTTHQVYKTRAAAVDASQGIPSGDSRRWGVAKQRHDAPEMRAKQGVRSYRERKADAAAAATPPSAPAAVEETRKPTRKEVAEAKRYWKTAAQTEARQAGAKRRAEREGRGDEVPSANSPAGRTALRKQMRETQQRWNEQAKAQRATVEARTARPPASTTKDTSPQPAAGRSENALFGLTPEQKTGQRERTADVLAEFSGTGAAKLLRGEPVRREHNGTVMEIRRDAGGDGWNYTVDPGTRSETSGRNLTLSDAVDQVRDAYEQRNGEELPVPAAGQKRLDAKRARDAANRPAVPERSDAQKRRALVARMSPSQQQAHIDKLEQQARLRPKNSTEGQRYQREANEARKVAAGLMDVETGRKIDPNRRGETPQARKAKAAEARKVASSVPALKPREEPANASPQGRDYTSTRPIAEVATAELDRDRDRQEKAQQSALPSLRARLADAQQEAEKYRKRHPVASTRSPRVQARMGELENSVRDARGRLARAEAHQRPGPEPTPLQISHAQQQATKAVEEFRRARDRVRRLDAPMSRAQERRLGDLYDSAVAAHKHHVSMAREVGDAEMARARRDAREPFRVRWGSGESRGFATREQADDAASNTAFRGQLAQVTTPAGETLATYNRRSTPEPSPLSDEQANRQFEESTTSRLAEDTDRISVESGRDVYAELAENEWFSDRDRAMYGRLAQRARDRMPAVERFEQQQKQAYESYRQRRQALQDRVNTAYRAGDLDQAETVLSELLELTRTDPQARSGDTSHAISALDRIQKERAAAQPAPPPATDADRIAAAEEAFKATNEEMQDLSDKHSASVRRHGANPSKRVQTNRDKLRTRFEELRTRRAEQQRALLEARHPEQKSGTPATEDKPTAYNERRVVEAQYPDGRTYRVTYDNYGGVTVEREGMAMSTDLRETRGLEMEPEDHVARMGASLDRIIATASSRTTDRQGRPVWGFSSREAITSALARVDTVGTYVAYDPNTREWTMRSTQPPQGRFISSRPDGGWTVVPGGTHIIGDTLRPDMLRVLPESTPIVDVSHETMRTGYHDRAEMTGDRRIQDGQVQVRLRYMNNAEAWVPLSVVENQLTE